MSAPTPTRTSTVLRVVTVMAVLVVSVAGVARAAGSLESTDSTVTSSAALCTRFDVVVLIDQSASLVRTDPENQRVEAAEVLVRSLAGSAAASGSAVDVTIAGFGSSATEFGRASLPAGAEDAVAVVRDVAATTTDRNTDYVQALSFAIDHFRATEGLPSDCKRLMWFTDGAYSIDDPAAVAGAGYTSSSDAAVIESELGGQICGPLPEGSRLGSPLSRQILDVGFVVQLVDLRSVARESASEQADREATVPVIDRLLTGDGSDPCRIPGGRVEAAKAGDLAGEFFTQGQLALGRRPVACDTLTAGVPAGLVRAVTVRGTTPGQGLAVTQGSERLAEGTGFVTWALDAAAGPLGSGGAAAPVRAGAAAGEPVAGCYADLGASIVPVGSQLIDPAATSTTLSWAVLPVDRRTGVDDRLGPDVVDVTATVAAEDAPVRWDPETRTWQVAVAGPVTEPPVVALHVEAPGWGGLASLASGLDAGVAMSPPRVAWQGPSRLEGDGAFEGWVRLTPAPLAAGTLGPDGVVCIELGPPTASSDLVTVQVPAVRSCYPAGESFDLPVTITVGQASNGELAVVLPYTVIHRPAGGGEDVVVATGVAEAPTFGLAKPADTLEGLLLAGLVVILSTVLPLILLIVLINVQRRLPPPSKRVVARVPLVATGGAVHRPVGVELTDRDLVPVDGTRDRYDLPVGLSLVRPRTLNPFAPTIVEVRSERGPVSVVPWMEPGAGRTVHVPAGFGFLVIILSEPGNDAAEAVVVAPRDAGPGATDRAVDDAIATTNQVWARVSSVLPHLSRA